ncbi:MAG: DegT/DnrJ/EryC1/StrS family aminotransferase [Calditrichia bacterium]
MNIQMVDLKRQYQRHKDEFDTAIRQVIESGQFINGPDVKKLQEEMQEYLQVKHAIPCASGTDALQLAMMALEIKPGDEVITTPFTFVATAETIALLGARPVYVDIDEKTYNIDPAKIEAAVTGKSRAIIPVHLYGQAADMDPILEIARKHNLAVIEDAAQAVGARYKNRPVCGLGDLGCISFFPSKNLGAYGDAGMVVTNSNGLAEKVKMVANHGSRVRYEHELLGVNSRLDTIQAAVLRVKLHYLDEWNNNRREFARYYNEGLRQSQITVPFVADYATHIFHQYTLQVPDRNGLQEYLNQKNIPNAIHYPIPLHLQPAFQAGSNYKKGDFPISERIAAKVISLPMHPDLNREELDAVIQAVNEYVGQ